MRLGAGRRSGEEEVVVQDGGDDLREAEAVSPAAMVVDRAWGRQVRAGVGRIPTPESGRVGRPLPPALVARPGAQIWPAFQGPLGLGSRRGAELQTGSQLSRTA